MYQRKRTEKCNMKEWHRDIEKESRKTAQAYISQYHRDLEA